MDMLNILIILSILIIIAIISSVGYIVYINNSLKEVEGEGEVEDEGEGETEGEGKGETEGEDEAKKAYTKIWDEAHSESYKTWVMMMGSVFSPELGRGLITKDTCKMSEYKSKNGDRDKPLLEWNDKLKKCISYPSAFLDVCDGISEQFGQPAGYFKYINPDFQCDNKGNCNMTKLPTCSVPQAYCEQQLASFREDPETCAGQCYVSEVSNKCSYLLGDVLCRMVGESAGSEVGRLLRSCNMGSGIKCEPPPGASIPNIVQESTLGMTIDSNRTKNGYLRPKNLWDINYAGELTINPKSEAASNSLRGIIQRQPWFLVSHDSDYKTPMGYFGHYYKNPGFKYYMYIDFLIKWRGGSAPPSTDNELHIYTIDLVNFSDWATEITTTCQLQSLKRMLTQMMITNFSMRSFNTLAVNGETWADKTKIFNLPIAYRRNPSSQPRKFTYREYGVNQDGNAPMEDYNRDSMFTRYTPATTDIVLMRWSPGYRFGGIDLNTLIRDNLNNIQDELFSVGEFISATKCPKTKEEWNTFKNLSPALRQASYATLCKYQAPKVENNVVYREYGTKTEASLILQNNSLICRLIVTPILLS